MDNQRLLVWVSFGLMVWLTYQAWIQDYAPATKEPAVSTTEELSSTINNSATADDGALPTLPEDAPADVPQLQAETPDNALAEPAEAASDTIHVVTDVLDVEISARGGTLTRALIRNYPVAKDRPDELVELLSPTMPELGIIRTGLISRSQGEQPNHRAVFTAQANEYHLDGADALVVPLTWTDGQGIRVDKEIRFSRGSYRIDVIQHVTNSSDAVWSGAEYAQLARRSRETERSMFNVDSYSFDGPIIYDGEKSEKLDRDDLISEGAYKIAANNGWMGSIQHHFLSAIVPSAEAGYEYEVSVSDGNDRSLAQAFRTSEVTIEPGSDAQFETTVFVGPKLQEQLEEVTETLKLTVDYGWLTIISQPLFWLLSKVHSVVGNWGLAIIFVTILIKLAFYKLTEASGRSMAKMREIQPRMKALQDRYKDDRQALSQAMMELYKREKVNPAAGCLPILIQMPFFLAFYWVLLESVEMRQAPFALWITDLSSRDPFFILPIIMGVAMLFQQRLNPPPGDPMQAKVMQIMPIVFTGFFAFFPAGLVLYWVTNTLLSIAQQWYINKIVHEEAVARKGAKKGDKKGAKKDAKKGAKTGESTKES